MDAHPPSSPQFTFSRSASRTRFWQGILNTNLVRSAGRFFFGYISFHRWITSRLWPGGRGFLDSLRHFHGLFDHLWTVPLQQIGQTWNNTLRFSLFCVGSSRQIPPRFSTYLRGSFLCNKSSNLWMELYSFFRILLYFFIENLPICWWDDIFCFLYFLHLHFLILPVTPPWFRGPDGRTFFFVEKTVF